MYLRDKSFNVAEQRLHMFFVFNFFEIYILLDHLDLVVALLLICVIISELTGYRLLSDL